LAFAALLPGQVLAQNPAADAQTVDLNRMHHEAIAVVGTSGQFYDELVSAAVRHAEVANLRTESDPMTFECLLAQASLLEGIGDLNGALEFTLKAAAHARSTGEILNAANAYVDAAVLVSQVPEGAGEAANLIDTARLLARSPSLSAEGRTMILSRIGDRSPVTVAAAW